MDGSARLVWIAYLKTSTLSHYVFDVNRLIRIPHCAMIATLRTAINKQQAGGILIGCIVIELNCTAAQLYYLLCVCYAIISNISLNTYIMDNNGLFVVDKALLFVVLLM